MSKDVSLSPSSGLVITPAVTGLFGWEANDGCTQVCHWLLKLNGHKQTQLEGVSSTFGCFDSTAGQD